MSTLPSYNYPYFGNGYPQISLVDFLQFTDPYSNYTCALCSKSMIVREGHIEGTDDNCFLICDFCQSVVGNITSITKAEFDAVYAAMGIIAANAIDSELSDSVGYPWV